MRYNFALISLAFFGCSNPPSAKTVETDLCEARAAFKGLEEVDSSLIPKPGSIRAQLEVDEDAFCSTLK